MTPHYIIMRLRYNGLGHFRGSWALRTVNLVEFAQMSKINVLNCLDEEIPRHLGSRHYAGPGLVHSVRLQRQHRGAFRRSVAQARRSKRIY